MGTATAADVKALIDLAHDTVLRKFEVDLELEVELMGEWGDRRDEIRDHEDRGV